MDFGFNETNLNKSGHCGTKYNSTERSLRHRRCPTRTMIGFEEMRSSRRSRQNRQVLQVMARPLKRWLVRHRDNPYPKRSEKIALAIGSQMTLVQVSNWFANARRRLKNTVKTPNVSWAKRVQLYNSCVEGNAELLSISSDDSIWKLDDDDDDDDNLTNAGRVTKVDHCYSTVPDDYNDNQTSTINIHSSTSFTGSCLALTDNDTDNLMPGRSKTSKRSLEEEEAASHVDKLNNYIVGDQLVDKNERPRKYKRSILQRYLHDSIGQNSSNSNNRPIEHSSTMTQKMAKLQDDVDRHNCHHRKFQDSTGTFSDSDFFTSTSHSSPSACTSRSSINWSTSPSDDEVPEQHDSETVKKSLEHTNSDNNGRYWKEFDAAIVLVSLGRATQ